MKTIAFKTLGCRLNQYETDALASQFQNSDYQIVNLNQGADVVVVNTCTVTGQSDQKSAQVIRQATRHNKNAVVVVAGCMVNNHGDKLQAESSDRTYFVDNAHKSAIYSLVEAHFQGEIGDPAKLNADLFNYLPAEKTFHTRSWVKIQDGCNNFCTYCIIPKVRGRATSRPVEDVLENIRQVIDFGYKEIVLTGVNIGRYTYDDVDFEALVEKILDLPGDFRLRIGSIEPEGFGDRLFKLFRHPKLTPHLHLCLQSGSDKILKKMRRMYSLESFTAIMEKVRQRYPDFNFTTDIIVGFPDETEVDFQESVEGIKNLGFGHIHTFKYSVREGTRAEKMLDHIPEKIKTQRSEIIRHLADEEKLKYRSSFIGKEQTVLVEKVVDGWAQGYGEHYLPVRFPTEGVSSNEFHRVKIHDIMGGEEPVLLAQTQR